MPKQRSRTVLTGWVLAIVRAMEADGVDVDAILQELGMDPALLQGGYSRYSQEQVSRLWRRAIELTGDIDFGLKVAAQVRPGTFHAVGYAMSCSATLARALHRFAFGCRVISDSATAVLTERGDTSRLEFYFDTGGAPPIYQTVETVIASVVSFLRWIINEPIAPLAVHHRHPNSGPSGNYARFLGCAVLHGQAHDCVVFRKSDLQRLILSGDEELAALFDGVVKRYLEQRMAGRFAVRVRDNLIAQLQHGPPSKAVTARMLRMSERTLLRRLKSEGTSFRDVVNQLRQELALQYLQRGEMTISEIAYRLGFSDEGAFSRAFKRWTGRRPSAVSRSAHIGRVPDMSEIGSLRPV